MNDTYVYRKHLRDYKLLLLYVNIFMVLLFLFISYGLKLSNYTDRIDGNIFITVFAVVVAFYILFYSLMMYIIIRKFRKIQVTLTDQGIVYNNRKKQIVIPYEQITKIECPSIKYTGGWVKIHYPGGNLRITVVLENIGEFLRKLKEQVDQRNMVGVYQDKKYFSFYKTAVFADESWSRIYRNAKVMALTCIISSAITTIILYQGYALDLGVKLIYASYIMPLVGYFISELIIGTKVKKRVDMVNLHLGERDEAYEKKVFNLSFWFFAILYVVVLILAVVNDMQNILY